MKKLLNSVLTVQILFTNIKRCDFSENGLNHCFDLSSKVQLQLRLSNRSLTLKKKENNEKGYNDNDGCPLYQFSSFRTGEQRTG